MFDNSSRSENNSQTIAIWSIFLSFITTLCFYMENGKKTLHQNKIDSLRGMGEARLWQLKKFFSELSYEQMLLFVLLIFAFFYLIPKIKKEHLIASVIFSLVAALMMLLCNSYFANNNWKDVLGSKTALMSSGIKSLGLAIPIFFIFNLLLGLVIEAKQNEQKFSFGKHFMIMFVLWIPYMIILFPGCMNNDTKDQVAQILGNADFCYTIKRTVGGATDWLWNNNHPVFYTFILSIVVKIGNFIKSQQIAFGTFAIVQSILLAASFVYSCSFLSKRGIPKKWINIMFCFFTLNPLFPTYGMTIMKDSLYGILFVITTIQMFLLLEEGKSYTIKKRIILFVLLELIILTRNNGLYIILALTPCIVILTWKNKKVALLNAFNFILPIVFYSVIVTGLVFNVFNIREGSKQDMYSVPCVQMARYVRDYGNDLDDEDKEHILAFFNDSLNNDVNVIADAYDPTMANHVKDLYRQDCSAKDRSNFMKTWLKCLKRHPACFVQAYLNLHYGWFSFDSEHGSYYYETYKFAPTINQLLPDLVIPEKLIPVQGILRQIIYILGRMPLVGWLIEFSFYTWAYLVMFILLCMRKKFKELLILGFVWFNYLICFIGPVAYTRYAIPMIMCFPIALIMTFSSITTKKG